MENVSTNKSFSGEQHRYKHFAKSLGCDMHFSIYLPPQATSGPVPQLYWLSGLTCTDENFVSKAGAQKYAAEKGIAIICPDTSPRGDNIPDDPDGAWDFGLGAGFYVNATQAPWAENYKMYDYIVTELSELINTNFPVDPDRVGISGHSMGGHGALTIGLKNTDRFKSVSAFSPIVSPLNCPWGDKALTNYLGKDRTAWKEYDACSLIKSATHHLPILIDQGESDDFLKGQLKPELIIAAADSNNYSIEVRYQPGYDHSYFFISSFIEDHIRFHAEHL
jgi:S-formylglutathione hydrolase